MDTEEVHIRVAGSSKIPTITDENTDIFTRHTEGIKVIDVSNFSTAKKC